MMYVSFDDISIYEPFQQKLTKAGWDYFVDLREVETELDVAKAFCTELYSNKMGPLRKTFNVNYFNDMMVEFFMNHADETLSIAVFGAGNLWTLGGKVSADVIALLLGTHRHGAFSAARKAKLGDLENIDALVNGGIRLHFIT